MAKQRLAVEAMQKSIESQRAAIQKQSGDINTSGFFILPPPTAAPDSPRPRETDCDALPDAEVTALVNEAARREDLDPGLLRSVMRQESGFRPCAVSEKGAAGLRRRPTTPARPRSTRRTAFQRYPRP